MFVSTVSSFVLYMMSQTSKRSLRNQW